MWQEKKNWQSNKCNVWDTSISQMTKFVTNFVSKSNIILSQYLNWLFFKCFCKEICCCYSYFGCNFAFTLSFDFVNEILVFFFKFKTKISVFIDIQIIPSNKKSWFDILNSSEKYNENEHRITRKRRRKSIIHFYFEYFISLKSKNLVKFDDWQKHVECLFNSSE